MVGEAAEGEDPVEGMDLHEHTHHWLIGKQDGPSSEGVCKACGEVRDFTNGFSRSYPGAFRAGGARPAPGA